jgi:hypothetical protein
MKFGNTFKEICTPARVYFFISAVAVIISLFSGFHFMAFLMKAGFVLVWTFLVNLLCKKGFKTFSWFFAFSPYIFILVGSIKNFREGADTMAPPAGGAPAGSPEDQTINYASKIQSSEASVQSAQDAVRAAFAKLSPEQQQAIMNSGNKPAFLNA